ncbi:MAG: hypothetical protein DI534_16080 [Leifsonia xyli]|nr:MAG: hypothetical protein DI534_16080 [Leifsonia xyli]
MMGWPIAAAKKLVVFVAMFAFLLLATSHSELDHDITHSSGASHAVTLGVNAPCAAAPTGIVAATVECSTPCAAWLPASSGFLTTADRMTAMAIRACSQRSSADLARATPPPRIG